TSLKTSIKTITYLSDIGCLEIQGASLLTTVNGSLPTAEIICYVLKESYSSSNQVDLLVSLLVLDKLIKKLIA
ncbi:hypothetical protein, partial [Escherichia coli]|uniref:hypothetical protein n=1 Tax=Escherichia coli TaxID=562 RepID=UPI001B8CC32F